jgi:hypothetical protein
VPAGVPVLRKPFARQDLISVVQATLARSVQVNSDLRREIERSTELKRQSTRLRAESAEARRQSCDILNRVRSRRKEC